MSLQVGRFMDKLLVVRNPFVLCTKVSQKAPMGRAPYKHVKQGDGHYFKCSVFGHERTFMCMTVS